MCTILIDLQCIGGKAKLILKVGLEMHACMEKFNKLILKFCCLLREMVYFFQLVIFKNSPVGSITSIGKWSQIVRSLPQSLSLSIGAWPNQYKIIPGPNLCRYDSPWAMTSLLCVSVSPNNALESIQFTTRQLLLES